MENTEGDTLGVVRVSLPDLPVGDAGYPALDKEEGEGYVIR